MSAISSAFSSAVWGLNNASNQLANTSQKIASYGTGSPGSDDLAGNLVDLSTEKTAFKASAVVLKTENQMLGTLLDVYDTPKKS
jgi:flagellar hook protein FlgE